MGVLKCSFKTDCRVSEWSTWSTPVGSGPEIRERKILREPFDGGKPCPSLKEEKTTGMSSLLNFVFKSEFNTGLYTGNY